MNLLTDELPLKVKIGIFEYEINSDFRTSIHFEELINNESIENDDKLQRAIKLYYPIANLKLKECTNREMVKKYIYFFKSLDKAKEVMMWFYTCGKEKSNNKSKTYKQVYSYKQDGEYIYSAFRDQYGINLKDVNMHWWEFKAMFNSLREDNKINKIISYRTTELKEIKDKEQRKFYKKMQDLFRIEKEITKEDKKELDELAKEFK